MSHEQLELKSSIDSSACQTQPRHDRTTEAHILEERETPVSEVVFAARCLMMSFHSYLRSMAAHQRETAGYPSQQASCTTRVYSVASLPNQDCLLLLLMLCYH
jgi:hypothetical protein